MFQPNYGVFIRGFGGLVVSTRVQTRPKPSDFSGEKILSMRKAVCPMSQRCGM
jgi:hypothetical protein